MKFKCILCNKNGVLGAYNTEMITFNYHKDNKGMNHTGIICLECGTIHDCLISYIKIIPTLLRISHPYKIVNVEYLPVWLNEVAKYKQDLNLNCMESAVMAVGIPEHVIELLKGKVKLGECFEKPISITFDDYQNRKSAFIVKKIMDNPSYYGLNG